MESVKTKLPPKVDSLVHFTIKPAVLPTRLALNKLKKALLDALLDTLLTELGEEGANEAINTLYQVLGYTADIEFLGEWDLFSDIVAIRSLWEAYQQTPIDYRAVYECYANSFTELAEKIWYKAISAEMERRNRLESDLLAPRELLPDRMLTPEERNDPFLSTGEKQPDANGAPS